MPLEGKAAKIMSVSQTYADGKMNRSTPCSYWISIIPITDYPNQGSPANPAPGKHNNWVSGTYSLSLRYMNEGSEISSKTFSFTIGADAAQSDAVKMERTVEINAVRSPRDVDSINQLNPQIKSPMPSNPSF